MPIGIYSLAGRMGRGHLPDAGVDGTDGAVIGQLRSPLLLWEPFPIPVLRTHSSVLARA